MSTVMHGIVGSPQNSYVEVLAPNVMVLGREAFGRSASDGVRRMESP